MIYPALRWLFVSLSRDCLHFRRSAAPPAGAGFRVGARVGAKPGVKRGVRLELEFLEGRIVPSVTAPVDQWTGANSATDLNWSDKANWSLNSVPTSSNIVEFSGNVPNSTVDQNFTARWLE